MGEWLMSKLPKFDCDFGWRKIGTLLSMRSWSY